MNWLGQNGSVGRSSGVLHRYGVKARSGVRVPKIEGESVIGNGLFGGHLYDLRRVMGWVIWTGVWALETQLNKGTMISRRPSSNLEWDVSDGI